MKDSIKAIILTAVFTMGASSLSLAQVGPKNLVSPTYRARAVQTSLHKGLTDKEARRLAVIAESPTDHMLLAAFYTEKANRLEARAVGYEASATAYRNGPAIKNLASPTTAGQYEFFASTLRGEAESARAVAMSHERSALSASR